MKNRGVKDSRINRVDKDLTYLSKHADLNQPEDVKHFIANLRKRNGEPASDGYKKNLCLAYDEYCNHCQIEWQMPRYRPQAKPIRVPTTEQVETLCASAGRILSVKLTLSKETGLRPIELCNLKVRDIDLQQRIVYPITAKHGAPRKLKISNSLTTRIETYINRHQLQQHDTLFKGDSDYYGKKYRKHRNQLAQKLNKPELKTIRLYDFRHYFATKLYAKTKSPLHVMYALGHKTLRKTLIYIHLLDLTEDDEWICGTASNIEESKKLIEAGFEYVTEQDGLKLYRKRK